MIGLLWGIVVALFAFWVAGLVLHVAGGFVHFLLFLAIALAIYNFIQGRSAV